MTKTILDTHYLIKSELNYWGNSVGFRIAKKALNLLGLTKGSIVSLAVKNNQLIIQKDVEDSRSKDFWSDVKKMDLKKCAKKLMLKIVPMLKNSTPSQSVKKFGNQIS